MPSLNPTQDPEVKLTNTEGVTRQKQYLTLEMAMEEPGSSQPVPTEGQLFPRGTKAE